MRKFSDELLDCGLSIEDLDGFFYSFRIPHIGKEFDLLRITDQVCLNIELKSTSVSKEKVLKQLNQNHHYLNHLGKQMVLYSVITDSMACYQLCNNELMVVDFENVVADIAKTTKGYRKTIDDCFRAANYLMSPINSPVSFIQGEYFLTQAQEEIKKSIQSSISFSLFGVFFHLTGKPGTGKTLLLYDLAKDFSQKGKTLIIHCGKLAYGHSVLSKEIEQLEIVSAGKMKNGSLSLENYEYILVDEAHRIYSEQFETICKSVKDNGQICVFSADPEQVLSISERRRSIVDKIKSLPLKGEYELSEKIRTNKDIHSFILRLMNLNHKPKEPMDYSSVEFNYANSTQEAKLLLEYYRKKGFVFINFSKSNYGDSPYALYEEDYDTHHVIGQEFDKVVMLMDSSFYYDDNGILKAKSHPNPNYLYPNLLYQGVTRVREKLAIIVVEAPDLFERVVSIVQQDM